MMIINHNKVKLENENANTRRNPDSTSGIYLTAVKVAQCRHVAENRRDREEAKKITTKKTVTRKVHLQLKISEDFDRCIKSINSLFSNSTDEETFIQLIQKSSNTINGDFVHMGGKFSKLPN